MDLLWHLLVDSHSNLALLQGESGSGKTCLAQEFVRLAADQFPEVFWIACGERSLASIAGDLAEQLGSHCSEGKAAEAWTRLLRELKDRRTLLVLDDLPQGTAIHSDWNGRASVLVTSRFERTDIIGAQMIPMKNRPEAPLRLPDDPADLRLWTAMALCHPGGFSLELVSQISGIEKTTAEPACTRLIERQLVDPFDDAEGRFRLSRHSLNRAAVALGPLHRPHAEAVCEAASRWRDLPALWQNSLAELKPAMSWATAANEWQLARKLTRYASAYFRSKNRLPEQIELLSALRDAAVSVGEKGISEACETELSWIDEWPRQVPDPRQPPGTQLNFFF